MRAVSKFALLCLSAVLSQAAAQTSSFERPINADCIALKAGSNSDVALFPPGSILVGDETTSTPTTTTVTFALGFKVDYYNTYKVVTNSIANETYVLYQCGTAAPPASALPAGAKLFEIPLTSISAPESVPYAFVENLGLENRVYDVSSYVTSPCGQKIAACGRVVPDTLNLDNATEVQTTLGPHVDGILATAPYAVPTTFAFSASQDPGALNRAEWIKFLGVFFNRERAASDAFAAVAKAYNATKAEVAAGSSGKKPVVAIPTYYVYGEDEYFQLSFAPYKAQFVQDAGGAMLDFAAVAAIPGVTVDAFANTTLDFAWTGAGAGFKTKGEAQAAFLKVLEGADVVVDETYAPDPTKYDFAAFEQQYGLNTVSSAQQAALPWLAPKRIFREDGLLSKALQMDWFEGAVARPDTVLTDFVRAVGPVQAASDGRGFTWIRNIQEQPVVVGPDACTRLTSCTADPAPICPFVSICGDGTPVLLQTPSSQSALCSYAACPGQVAAAAGAPVVPSNTAQMAAPAVVLLTVLIVFVEALINFC